ncbi:hypothetical protein CsSME_00007679 [Camellia sinensis var. sinensis]
MCFCIKHGISHKIYISSGWNCCYPILPITVGIVAAISLLKLAIQSSAPAVVNPARILATTKRRMDQMNNHSSYICNHQKKDGSN